MLNPITITNMLSKSEGMKKPKITMEIPNNMYLSINIIRPMKSLNSFVIKNQLVKLLNSNEQLAISGKYLVIFLSQIH